MILINYVRYIDIFKFWSYWEIVFNHFINIKVSADRKKDIHAFMEKVTDVYDSIVGNIHVTRIINKELGRIFLSIRPGRLKYPAV